jgi:hypothetical protein
VRLLDVPGGKVLEDHLGEAALDAVLEVGGAVQHGALVAREYGKPCVVGDRAVGTARTNASAVQPASFQRSQ